MDRYTSQVFYQLLKLESCCQVAKLVTKVTPPRAVHSHLQIRADTKQDVIDTLRKDPFSRNGVWNVDDAIIYRLDTVYREKLDLT